MLAREFTMRHTMIHRLLLLLAALLLASRPARAQFELDEPEAPGDAAAAADEAPAATPEDSAALLDFGRRDPIVAAVLELPRETPAQRLRAIFSLVDLGRYEVAALLLPQLESAELDDAARAALVNEFGPARFMQLVTLDAPAAEGAASSLPGARAFAQQCLDAASAIERDPARIGNLIQQLSADSADERYAARVDLRATGEPGLVAMLHALATATTPESRGNMMAALADMRPTLDEPLVAMLAESRGQPRADAATLAGKLRIRAALPYLSALAVSHADPGVASIAQAALIEIGLPLPAPAEAQALIRTELASVNAAPVFPDNEVQDAWWSWDDAASQPTSTQVSSRQRRMLARARLAQALVEAGGAAASPADRLSTLIDALEAARLLGRPLPAEMATLYSSMSPSDLSAALHEAVAQQRFTAAAALATELGARKDPSVLATHNGRPSPLAAALASPARDLRFAALSAIMQLKPQHSFPGASYVPAALWYFAAGGGDATAVVASPVFPRATDWAGQFRRLGYEAMPTGSGRSALVAAFDRAAAPRLAIILIDSDIGQPLAREVVFQLRSADLTAGVPIIIAASEHGLVDAQRIAAQDPLVLAVLKPRGEALFDEAVNQALALNPRPLADKATRTQQAAQALEWLATLLAAGAPYDELRRDGALVNSTLYIPELAAPSIRVLAALGTADSQSALADYASSRAVSIDLRRQAADALAASIKQFGIQLTSEQILRQYDRYNASATADADTQQLLGGILDSLEKKK